MVSFYPGPSRVYDEIPKYVKAAQHKGILSMNHRSEGFTQLYEKTVALLRERLSVPQSYRVFFTSSATECWEIIAQSVVSESSIHLYSGAFGEKWYDYTKKIKSAAQSLPFDREVALAAQRFDTGDVICVTHNETSNGTMVAQKTIAALKAQNPKHLVAVDATSSMAGIALDFSNADIWFASVQKCFGLPAGLAVMICSPAAIARIAAVGEKGHYNSMTVMNAMLDKWQTSCTPNVLGIYLLMRTLKKSRHIDLVDAKLHSRMKAWLRLLKEIKGLEPLIKNDEVRSPTVVAVKSTGVDLGKLKVAATKAGFLLGEGYGDLKKDTIRIANFPALKRREIQKLMRFLLRQV